jgi:two-component system chemotaxis response regulator CheY
MQMTSPPVGRSSFWLDLSQVSFLLVDDQPFARRMVHSMLLGFGSREVYESANGIEAIEAARAMMPDIIISDLIMPNSDGLRFLKMAKSPQSPVRHIPIIVLSGYLTKAAALTIRNMGADELLVKPVSPKALYEHITRVVLRDDQANMPPAFVRNQEKRAEMMRKKTTEIAFV